MPSLPLTSTECCVYLPGCVYHVVDLRQLLWLAPPAVLLLVLLCHSLDIVRDSGKARPGTRLQAASVRLTGSAESACWTMPLEAVTAVTASNGMVPHTDCLKAVKRLLTDAVAAGCACLGMNLQNIRRRQIPGWTTCTVDASCLPRGEYLNHKDILAKQVSLGRRQSSLHSRPRC